MTRDPDALEDRVWDVVVIGGGITGACLAFDAATRGMSVALLEKDDFGAATSSASSKLLHGGLRYLQNLRFGKVRESAYERLYFQNLAPHLTRWVPFVVPTYRSLARGKLLLGAGMALYELLCLGQNRVVRDPGKRVPSGEWLTADEVRRRVPGIDRDGLTGGRLFHECHMHSSERMTLAFVQGACREGARALNYVRADELVVRDDRVEGVRATELVGGGRLEVRGRMMLNAAGPWIHRLNEGLGSRSAATLLTGLARGAHIVAPSLTRGVAVALPTRRRAQHLIDRGGRHVFVIPWRDRSLIGTTYAPFEGPPDQVAVTSSDIDELVTQINAALGSGTLERDEVMYAYAGLYPLTEKEIRPDLYQGAEDSVVIDHASRDGVTGLVSVLGAKYTTARLLAERTLDRVSGKLDGTFAPCRTREIPLPAGDIDDLDGYRRSRRGELDEELDSEVIDNLVSCYGRDLASVLATLRERPELAERLVPDRPTLAVQALHAAREEMVVHLDDVVFRRTGLGTLGNPGRPTLIRVAAILGEELGWSKERQKGEVDRTLEEFPL